MFVVNDNIEEFASGNSFKGLDEGIILNLEKLEDTAFNFLSVKVWFRIFIL